MTADAKFFRQIDHQNTEWKQQAACRNADPSIFFPTQEGDTTAARQYCTNCPVQNQCAQYGLKQDYGIWGGLSPAQRARRHRTYCPNGHSQKTHGKAYRDGKGNMIIVCLECRRTQSRQYRERQKTR